ncbi:proline-rich membrane anchor 1 isoform X6 [Scyliorhinus canicula]|uniref:proline-rich membrane anchor 1 isoform X6 n=1 Tax=Scyliorhinus canicula TaxID=7830 RepID=UPI0018F79250|nr:proline-rich membrane anchor 1 isoform X6 [Scyliorhinus canicula]
MTKVIWPGTKESWRQKMISTQMCATERESQERLQGQNSVSVKMLPMENRLCPSRKGESWRKGAVKPTDYPPLKPWWTDMVILIAVGCATLVFLVIAVIICYKAIKRKPMRKEENGTSRAEYAMTSQNDKMPDTNSAII